MDFKQALRQSLRAGAPNRPFLLHARISDLVGNDYEAKRAAEAFCRLDAKYEISKIILASAPIRYRIRHKHTTPAAPTPPRNARVYITPREALLHLSGECPRLATAERVYRTTYAHAKTLDFKRTHLAHRSRFYQIRHLVRIAKRARRHKPPVCRRCGAFTPRITNSIFYELAEWMLLHLHIDMHRKSIYRPSSLARLRARLQKSRHPPV